MGAVLGTSYTSEDPDILQVEDNYIALEQELERRMANIESEFPGYDEYQYDVDTIGHDPNELISYLTAKFNAFTPAQVQAELEALFDQQYTLTTREEVQIPGLGETTVTGTNLGWPHLAKQLQLHGHNVTIGEWENGQYRIVKNLDVADFIPLRMKLEQENRIYTIDQVDYAAGRVSLRDDTFGVRTGFPIFRNEPVSIVREWVERQQEKDLAAAARTEEMLSEAYEQSQLDTAQRLITEFCEYEYGSEVDFTDLRHIGLACTTTDNEQHILQVEADLVEPSISYLLDGELVHRDKYQNLSKLILKELVTLDFDHLIRTGLDAAQREPAAIQEDVKPYHRYSVIEASSTDSYVPDGGRFAIFDEATWDYYFDEDSWAKVFPDAESAAQFIKELEKADAEKQQPDLTGQPITREGDTLTIGNGPATHEVDITVSDEVWKQIKEAIPDNTVQNFHITDPDLGAGGQKTKYQNNVAAIRLLKDLEEQGRSATPEEQEILSRYVGWGGIPQAFDEANEKWASEYAELKTLLTPEEYASARGSTLNAHFTSPTVIEGMYQALEKMGVHPDTVLEPAMGVGNFFGLLPESMQGAALVGVELDSITGRLAKQLYPQASITVDGFERVNLPDNSIDLAVGNVPFGSYKLADPRYDRQNLLIHDYFFVKTMDKVRPGGIVAFITSKGTLDKQDSTVREYLAQRADLLGAVRLPNNAFSRNAGTDVTTDMLFLQKRAQPPEQVPDWVHLGQTADGIPINRYFETHPDIHCHIEFNSTTLDCTHKFNNYRNTYQTIRKINDRLCREHGLSVIEKPKEKGKHYAEWANARRGTSWKKAHHQLCENTRHLCGLPESQPQGKGTVPGSP